MTKNGQKIFSHYINTLQGQIQYHATRAQGLQISLDSVQQQQVNANLTFSLTGYH